MRPHQLRTLRLSSPWLDDPAVFRTAAAHRFGERWVPRRTEALRRWPVERKAHLLVGARQVGKSTLLWRRFEAAGTAPLFIDAEQQAMREWATSPLQVLADLRELIRPGMPVFIDEAQWLDEAGLLLKALVDGGLEAPLYVTGSSAFHLHSRTRESLAGRAVRTMLHPLSLAELAADPLSVHPDASPLIRRAQTREVATRHMVVGGFPEVWLADEPGQVLDDLVEAVVVRDASDLFGLKHVQAFRGLLLLLAGQTGQLVNFAEWATHLGVSRDTVDNYATVLEDALITYRLRPFAGGRRAELTRRPKLMLADPGIRNALVGSLAPYETRADRGAVFECWVGAELRKHLDPLHPADALHYWRTKSGAEVDFVVARPDRPVAVEAKAAALKRPVLSRAARSFIEAYEPSVFVVMNLALRETRRVGRTEVRWRPPEAMAEPNLLD